MPQTFDEREHVLNTRRRALKNWKCSLGLHPFVSVAKYHGEPGFYHTEIQETVNSIAIDFKGMAQEAARSTLLQQCRQ